MTQTHTATLVRSAIGAVLAVPFVGVAAAQQGGQASGANGGMAGGMTGGMGGFGWWPLLASVVLLAALAFVAYASLVRPRGGRTNERHTEDAVATLRERYARGDLTADEFDERRRRLEEQ
ncbi:SHOCT domain-containing protein [Halobacterium bonnevillei]|uniref:SHOCT domain-containing protein n=1 Tax=Halobacterium bonnevillei TaxID=2692200 RepID=A0A6B0SHV2_9EURY|nr:SHOCT domain-containing protein [Halobacterium bonnevillei]MXR20657.1 SHOCT domain-containing protein [Halobacterium bonnevillei]